MYMHAAHYNGVVVMISYTYIIMLRAGAAAAAGSTYICFDAGSAMELWIYMHQQFRIIIIRVYSCMHVLKCCVNNKRMRMLRRPVCWEFSRSPF